MGERRRLLGAQQVAGLIAVGGTKRGPDRVLGFVRGFSAIIF